MTTQIELALEPSTIVDMVCVKKINADKTKNLPVIISLFCGAGGLDLGFHLEGFDIPLAIDKSAAAIKSYNRNFEGNHGIAKDLTELGPQGVLRLVKERIPKGTRLGVIGGPPCQGFSRANALSQADDERNKLPSLYLEIVEKLQKHYPVEFVVFENVLGIRDKKHLTTYKHLVHGLELLKFDVTEKVLIATDPYPI